MRPSYFSFSQRFSYLYLGYLFNSLVSCVSFLLQCNKKPQTQLLKMTPICLILSVAWNSGPGTAGFSAWGLTGQNQGISWTRFSSGAQILFQAYSGLPGGLSFLHPKCSGPQLSEITPLRGHFATWLLAFFFKASRRLGL